MSTKSGCIVYNPAENSWCVLVEYRKKNGEIRRFMSFHKSREEAEEIKKAQEAEYTDESNVTISIFEYEYVPDDTALALRLIRKTVNQLVEEVIEKIEKTNKCSKQSIQ